MNLTSISRFLGVSIKFLTFMILIQVALGMALLLTGFVLSHSFAGILIALCLSMSVYFACTRMGMAAAYFMIYVRMLYSRPWLFSVLGKITIASMLFTFGLEYIAHTQLDMEIPRMYATVKTSMLTAGLHVILAFIILLLYAFRHIGPRTKRKGGYYYIVQRLPAPKESLPQESS